MGTFLNSFSNSSKVKNYISISYKELAVEIDRYTVC
jgi:hypothetical protein